MIRARNAIFLAMVSALGSGCGRSDRATPDASSVPAPSSDGSRPATIAPTPSADAATRATPSIRAEGIAQYRGRIEGRGAVPPIQEFAPTVTTEAWNGGGELNLEIPDGNGAVRGTAMLDSLAFVVRGFRSGARVTATLEEPASDGGVPYAREIYRGTIDAEITSEGLRGTWEASADGGRRRRRGTVTATTGR